MPTVKCLATLRRLRTLPARVLGDVQQPGGGRRLRLVLGAALGGYAQPLSLEADDGGRRARDLAGRRQGQRADPGPRVAVSGGEEHLVQLPRPRLPGRDPALAVRDQRGVRGAVLACLLQRREELIAGHRREAGGRVGQQRAQFLARAVLLHLGLPPVPWRRRFARGAAGPGQDPAG